MKALKRSLLAHAGHTECCDPLRIENAELRELLLARNGFHAFSSALQVFGSGRALDRRVRTLEEWNQGSWRDHFPALRGHVVFAQDLFAGQISVDPAGEVHRLSPETGDTEKIASSIRDWEERVLRDVDLETGRALAEEWQSSVRRLDPWERLLPIRPFVVGGDFDVDNLIAVASEVAMVEYGRLAEYLGRLPDGTAAECDFWLESSRASAERPLSGPFS